MNRLLSACASLSFLASAAAADPVQTVVLDAQLDRQPLTLERIDQGVPVFSPEIAPDGELLAIVFSAHTRPPARVSPPGVVVLTDGKRWSGALSARPSGDPDLLAWAHPEFGRVLIPLEQIQTVTMPGTRPLDLRATDQDIVAFLNGDVAAGFVVSIGDALTLEALGQTTQTPIAFVSEVAIANELTHPAGPKLVLADGSIVDGVDLDLGSGVARVERVWTEESSEEVGSLPATQVLAYVPDSSRFVSLTELEVVSSRPLGTGLVQRRPEMVESGSVLGLDHVRLPGVMVVSWQLPDGASRFAADVELPRASLGWGDCELVVLTDGLEQSRVRLNADAPQARIALDLPADSSTLTLRLEPGENGPIRDRVLIREPVLRIDPLSNP